MAGIKKTRSQLAVDDFNIYLPDNNAQDIEPIDHRQVNEDINASTLNLLDDNITNGALDGSLRYTADPTAGWTSDPSNDLKFPTKKYVDNLTGGVEQYIFYVSKFGNDGTAVAGNINKPYLTINAAITASNLLPNNSYITVKVNPGNYTESISINKTAYYSIDMSGVRLGGSLTITSAISCSINLLGGVIQGTSVLSISCSSLTYNSSIFGGTILNAVSCNLSSTGRLQFFGSEILKSTGVDTISVNTTNCDFINCEIINTTISGGAMKDINGCQFFNCTITNISATSPTINQTIANASKSKFFNCVISGDFSPAIRLRNSSAFDFHNCAIRSTNGYAIAYDISGISAGITFDSYIVGCRIQGGTSSVYLSPDLPSQFKILFQNCDFVSVNEPFVFDETNVDWIGKVVAVNSTIRVAQVATDSNFISNNLLLI